MTATPPAADRASRWWLRGRGHLHLDPRRWRRRCGYRARAALPRFRQSGARGRAVTFAPGGADRQGFTEPVSFAISQPVAVAERLRLAESECICSGDRQPERVPDQRADFSPHRHARADRNAGSHGRPISPPQAKPDADPGPDHVVRPARHWSDRRLSQELVHHRRATAVRLRLLRLVAHRHPARPDLPGRPGGRAGRRDALPEGVDGDDRPAQMEGHLAVDDHGLRSAGDGRRGVLDRQGALHRWARCAPSTSSIDPPRAASCS